MRRSQPIVLLAATALALPSSAAAAEAPGMLLAAAPGDLLAAAQPLSDVAPPPRGDSLSRVPIADATAADAAALLAANPEQAGELLAQAPEVTATPPATLPRTGSELWLTLMLGAGLMLTGTGMRLRLRPAGEVGVRAGIGAAPGAVLPADAGAR